MSNAKKLLVLISGKGSNLQALIDSITSDKLNAEIVAVISNRADAFGLERAALANIPAYIIDHHHYETRESFDQSMIDVIDRYHPDLLILAGFMRILSPLFVERYLGQLVNIHPSLLPHYRGLNTHQRALSDKASQHGASVHFVTPELDAGAVLIHGIVTVKSKDTETCLENRVHQVEHIIYPKAIKLLINHHIILDNNRIIFDDKRLVKPKQYYLK